MSNVVKMPGQAMAELGGVFDLNELAGDLTDGVSSGYGILSIRGSKFRVKKGGEERPVLGPNGDPVGSLEVVLLKANKGVSKVYYVGTFEEGSHEAPDCSSINGVTPDANVPNPQAASCAGCPQNAWGSRMTDSGKKAKACSDSRRVAVVPANDIPNDIDEGALLLRIPPASLQDLVRYGRLMQQKGFAYNAIATRLGFDLETAYPKLTFKPIRALDEAERQQVTDHFNGEVVNRILTDSAGDAAKTGAAPAAPVKQDTVSDEFEIEPGAEPAPAPEPEPVAKKPVAKKRARKKVVAKKEAAPAAPPMSDAEADINSAMDSLLADMDGTS